MRIIPDYISQSLTVSTRTEAMLIKIKDKCYFVEYPTNKPPSPSNLFQSCNKVTLLTEWQFKTICGAFEAFIDKKVTLYYLHAPSYLHGHCGGVGIDLVGIGILC